MLCPEVWNFKAPASDIKFEKTDNFSFNNINNFLFNHLVSVTVPDALTIPKCLSDTLLNDCEYYKICNLKVNDLINATFINNFIKSGTISLLSIDTKIDCENCVSVLSSKILVLSLVKETYQALGLEGSVSQFCSDTKYKYIVKIDLTKLIPGTNTFERTKNCLKTLGSFNVIVLWEPPDADICPSSIAKYFDTLDYEVRVCTPKYDTQTRYTLKAPIIDFISCDETMCAEYIEWLGMLTLDGDLESGSPANYSTSYEIPEPSITFGQIKTLTWTGYFSHQKLQLLFNQVQAYQLQNNKPWISIYVQGFSDAPISWTDREHHYYTNGDNSYTVLMNSTNYIIYSSRCSYKRYNKKQKNKRR